MRSWLLVPWSRRGLAALLFVLGCAGDDTTNGDGVMGSSDTSGPPAGSSTGSASTGMSASTVGSSSGADSSSGAATTGGVEDPGYPAPDGMNCAVGFPIELPGAAVCVPSCTGATDTCREGATGDATPECTPFTEDGGSGDPCLTPEQCPDGEVCEQDGTCATVAFWGCRLLCVDGEQCPDGMVCSGIGVCGYAS